MAPHLKSFAQQLADTFDQFEARFAELIAVSSIIGTNPHRYRDTFVAPFPEWKWADDSHLIGERTRLLRDYDEWFQRFRLLHTSPVSEVEDRIRESDTFIRRWLDRGTSDHSIPESINHAQVKRTEECAKLRALIAIGVHGPSELLVIPDTNVLMNNPDVAAYQTLLDVNEYVVILLPTVLSELDEQKSRGKTLEVREAADKASRRLKGLRGRGDLRTGVKVDGRITLRALHVEPDLSDILSWLRPEVPDDRILGGALRHQGDNPASTVVLVTGDILLQTKAAVAGMPFVDPT